MKKLLSFLIIATIITSSLCVSYLALGDNITQSNTAENTTEPVTEISSTVATTESTIIPTTTEPIVKVKNIKVNKSIISLSKKGKTATVKVTVYPSNSYNKSVTWKSNNTKVATVDKNGKIKATTNKGVTYVTARAKDGSNKFSKVFVVVGQKVQKITLNKSFVTLNRSTKNITYQLKKSIRNNNATYKAVNWYTSNKNIATVDSNGKVTVRKRGTVTITARAKDGSNKAAKCKITVKQLVTKLSYSSKKQAKEVYRNKTIKFNVIVAPSNANNKGIIYSSSNKKVATVTSRGLIKGIKEGTAIIIARAKDSSKKAVKLIVKVKKPPINFYTKISKDEFNEPKNIKTYVDALNKYFESCGAVINPNMVGSSQWCVVTTTTFNNNISIYDRYVSTIGMWTWRRSQDEVDNGFEWKNLKPGKSLENFLQLLDDYSFYNSGKYNPKKILDSNWNGWKQFCQYDNTDDIVNIYVYPVKAQDMNAYTVYMYWGTNAGLKLKGIPLVKE